MRLDDASVLITGASGGIGREVAIRCAARGALLVLQGRDERVLADLADAVRGRYLRCDLTTAEGIAAAAAAARGVDVVVHAAGVGWWGRTVEMAPADVEALVALDLIAPIRLTQLLLPAMIERGRGHIHFVCSIAGLTGVAGEAVYSAAKAGLSGFADALRLELAGTGVAVSTISPGAVATGFRVPGYVRRLPRPVRPDRVAAAVVAAVEGDRPRTILPRWLAVAAVVRAAAPRAYNRLARRYA
ncbi:MAG: SDR family NAD(P)-dependent oxidoreductase [Jatrophihabitans sp.]|nr:MAG: SDR family NAD(P)-dependent oxidoreductase [Jatrophihabitans sp.]